MFLVRCFFSLILLMTRSKLNLFSCRVFLCHFCSNELIADLHCWKYVRLTNTCRKNGWVHEDGNEEPYAPFAQCNQPDYLQHRQGTSSFNLLHRYFLVSVWFSWFFIRFLIVQSFFLFCSILLFTVYQDNLVQCCETWIFSLDPEFSFADLNFKLMTFANFYIAAAR